MRDITENERLDYISRAKKADKLHHGVGVYKNGTFKQNCIPDFDLDSHIDYNVIMRCGRGLFIDGKCVHAGYLTDAEVAAWEEKIKDWPLPGINYPRQ